MHTIYDPYEVKVANEIAHTLNDKDSIPLHLQYVRTFQETHLRKVLAKVMAIPENKIKRSRAALYTFLINQSRTDDSRH